MTVLCGMLTIQYSARIDRLSVRLSKWARVQIYCSDFYGIVLWDMTHSAIEDVCVAWRKGLRRVWDLPAATHAKFVTSP